MRKRLQLVGVLVVALSMLVIVPAWGAPPLPDAGINLAGSTEATVAAAPATIHYGDSVSFDHWMDGKTAKNYYLTIRVHCTQPEVGTVYDWYGQPDFAFPLHDQLANGDWWDGGDATCTAHLRYFANNRLSIIAVALFDVTAV